MTRPSGRIVPLIVAVAFFMENFDGTAIATALPTMAAAFGVRAVDLLAAGKADRMVGWWNRTVIDVPLDKVVGRSRTVDPQGALIRTGRALGICLGDAA